MGHTCVDWGAGVGVAFLNVQVVIMVGCVIIVVLCFRVLSMWAGCRVVAGWLLGLGR